MGDKEYAVRGDLLAYISDGTPQAIVDRYASLADASKESDYGELDRDIVVIDTETTGFSFNHDELTQIAAARMDKGEIVDWFVTFVNPGKPIPEDVAHLTNIHDEDVADAPSPEERLRSLPSSLVIRSLWPIMPPSIAPSPRDIQAAILCWRTPGLTPWILLALLFPA